MHPRRTCSSCRVHHSEPRSHPLPWRRSAPAQTRCASWQASLLVPPSRVRAALASCSRVCVSLDSCFSCVARQLTLLGRLRALAAGGRWGGGAGGEASWESLAGVPAALIGTTACNSQSARGMATLASAEGLSSIKIPDRHELARAPRDGSGGMPGGSVRQGRWLW